MRSIDGSSAAMREGANARDTSRRSRVWSGGSTASMCRAKAGPGSPASTTSGSRSSAATMHLHPPPQLEPGADLAHRRVHDLELVDAAEPLLERGGDAGGAVPLVEAAGEEGGHRGVGVEHAGQAVEVVGR